MKIKFGALVVAGSGKIGGHVASKNRAGAYLRTKVTPVNRNTSFKAAVKSRLSAISSGWKALTAAQITAWNAAVAMFKNTNVFGDVISPSGAQLYQRLNNNISIISGTPLTAPPLPKAVGNLGVLTLTAAKGTPAMSLAFTSAIAATEKVKVYATEGISPGVNFVKSQYRLIGVLDNADTTPNDLLSLYVAKFGVVPVAGLKVYIQTINVCIATGQPGIALSANCVVAA